MMVFFRMGYAAVGDPCPGSIEMIDSNDGSVLAEFDESGDVYHVHPSVAHALRFAASEIPDWLIRSSMCIDPDVWRARFDRWMTQEEQQESVYYGVWRPR